MSPELVALLSFAAILLLITFEMPVALTIALTGVAGVVLIDGWDSAGHVISTIPYAATAKYSLFVIPMYVLLGCLISNAGIGARIYRSVNRLVGRLPGGLGATAVGATALFSGISGSSAADVATFGRISVTEMTRHGYPREYAAAIVAAAGAFAALIPPSIIFVVYGVTANISIGALIIAGIVPGLASCLALATFVVINAIRHRRADDRATVASPPAPVHALVGATSASAAGSGASQGLEDYALAAGAVGVEAGEPPAGDSAPANGWVSDFVGIVYAAILFAIVVGGLYSGIFTATEAGAVGAAAALIIAVLAARSNGINLRHMIVRSVHETVNVTSMIFLLLVGGAIFSYLIALSGLPVTLSNWIGGLDVPPKVIVALILVLLIPLGAFLDGLTILLLTVPVVVPVVLELGFDGVWFGVLVIKLIEIGLITPPVGINAFIISSLAGVPVEKVFKSLAPFVILDLAITAVFFLFPDIILWLPREVGLLA